MNCTHLLAETPDYLREKQLVKYSNFGSNKYGVNASAAINNYANSLIREWLIKPVEIAVSKNGEDEIIHTQNLYLLRCRALIEELVAFNTENNFDRIRALGMVMLYREEKVILYQGDMKRDDDKVSADYLGNDPFFNRNYEERKLGFNY